MFGKIMRWAYKWTIHILDFCNLLEDEAEGKARRLSLTNVSFWAALLFAGFIVTKAVIMVDAPDLTEFGLVAVSSVIAALLRERKSGRSHARDGYNLDDSGRY